MTPYQTAKTRKVPFIDLKVDTRTKLGRDGKCIRFWGPATDDEAERVLKLITSLVENEEPARETVEDGR